MNLNSVEAFADRTLAPRACEKVVNVGLAESHASSLAEAERLEVGRRHRQSASTEQYGHGPVTLD